MAQKDWGAAQDMIDSIQRGYNHVQNASNTFGKILNKFNLPGRPGTSQAPQKAAGYPTGKDYLAMRTRQANASFAKPAKAAPKKSAPSPKKPMRKAK